MTEPGIHREVPDCLGDGMPVVRVFGPGPGETDERRVRTGRTARGSVEIRTSPGAGETILSRGG